MTRRTLLSRSLAALGVPVVAKAAPIASFMPTYRVGLVTVWPDESGNGNHLFSGGLPKWDDMTVIESAYQPKPRAEG